MIDGDDDDDGGDGGDVYAAPVQYQISYREGVNNTPGETSSRYLPGISCLLAKTIHGILPCISSSNI